MNIVLFGYWILIRIDYLRFISISVFSLVLVSIEKIYQTFKTVPLLLDNNQRLFKTVFIDISKHINVGQK